ncbi:hypothetical protein [Sinomicrobium weinanense]|uniref:Uncharacterized protein n=1 Tax=Sinomicrobium weinanense TaxID=2842200 RepID=A0A926JP81_9FLAO|nr:hypothetical protein [Sinomicrobium weinanense]MBC9794789.1 hypothetical protein [Sinomicrobium weinanense]MBU3125048.1 hypothetical protein [Sinomicrobium weinanense]
MTINGILTKGKVSNLTYYNEIPRTSDLLKSAEFSVKLSSDLVISNYYIAPATVKFDSMVEESIYEINQTIYNYLLVPEEKQDILNLTLEEYIGKYKSEAKVVNLFKDDLQKKGFSGELIKVASNINASNLNQLTRALLSEEGIFFYLAYRAVIGNDIKDAEGIAANIMDALGLIKSFINIKLVDKVIAKENLNVSESEVQKIKGYLSNKTISYASGSPEKTIVGLIDDFKAGGNLYTMVRDFLTSGKVDLPRNVNIDALIQKMVNYLLKIGYNYEENETGPVPGETDDNSDGSVEIVVPDDFRSAIEGVGDALNRRLTESGITTFSHLASFNNETLKVEMGLEGNFNYDNIIEQAKLIATGKFKELVKLQDKLYKRQ